MGTSDVAELIRQARRVTAFCHENPDADTLGAGLAIRFAAEALGKQAEVVCVDPPPPFLAFLPGIDEVRRAPALEPDVAVIVDAGDLSRIGSVAQEQAAWLERATILNIDHHISNPRFGAAHLVEPDAAATCELVALLLPKLGVQLDERIATVLMAGIVQDTHTFAHPNATPRTLRVAADLVEAGAPLSAINRAVYADKPYSTMALWGRMLAGIDQRCDGRIVFAAMTAAMLAETGEQPTASEGFIDLLGQSEYLIYLDNRAASKITQVTVTNTVPVDPIKRPDKIDVLPVTTLLAETIMNVFADDSVSAIFGGENQLF